MGLSSILLIVHLFGFAWGIGSATVSDILFFKSIKDRVITSDELGTLKTVSRVVVFGITIAVLSGAAMLYNQYLNTGGWPLLELGRFQAKMTLVAMIIINGIVFHRFVFPLMKRNVNKPLNESREIRSKLWLFSITGAVSFVSWYGAALLAFLKTLSLSYVIIINAYLILVLGATMVGHLMLSRIVLNN